MEKWYSRYRRGDVWFLRLDREDGDGRRDSSVEKKSRPYLIVSCEENNQNAPTLNVIPITTRNNDRLPMHVFFIFQDGTPSGRNQVILCEQITTVSEKVFENSQSRFLYSLNLELMNKVDEALTRQLGLKPRVADMKVIERLVDELAAQKEAELRKEKERAVQARVEVIVSNLAKRFGINLTAEALQNDTEYRDEELRFADPNTIKEMRQTAATRKQRVDKPKHVKGQPWTDAQKREFVNDYTSMPRDDMAKKWGLSAKSIPQTACEFRKALDLK